MSDREAEMALAGLVEESERVRRAPEEEQLPRTVALGEALETALAAPDDLRLIAEQIVETATELKCDAVAGASPLGDRIAAAAVAIGGNGLRSFTSTGIRPKHLLVVDGLLATGAQLERAIRRAAEYGITRTSGAVVISLLGADDPPPGGLSHLRLLSSSR